MSLTLVFSPKVYSVETIKRAAYRFSDVIFVDITPSEDVIVCALVFLSEVGEGEAHRMIATFKNEVLDQDLRATIAKETEATRNAVLAYALSKTGLQGGE